MAVATYKQTDASYRTVSAHSNGEYTTRKADGTDCCHGKHFCDPCETAVRRHEDQTVSPPPSLSALIRQQRGERSGTENTAQTRMAANGAPQPPRLSDHLRQLRARSGEESGNV
jgi:hypothetical protein